MAKLSHDEPVAFSVVTYTDDDGASLTHPERLMRNDSTDIREPYPDISIRVLQRAARQPKRTSR